MLFRERSAAAGNVAVRGAAGNVAVRGAAVRGAALSDAAVWSAAVWSPALSDAAGHWRRTREERGRGRVSRETVNHVGGGRQGVVPAVFGARRGNRLARRSLPPCARGKA